MRENYFRLAIFATGMVTGLLLTLIYARQNLAPPPLPNQTNNIERDAASLVVKEPPDTRLPAPDFLHPGVLTSDSNGQIYLAWSKIPGAQRYRVTVLDSRGQTAKELTLTRNVTSVKGLYVNPKAGKTSYTATVVAVDESGNPGHQSEAKDLAMLPMRNLAPPSIKEIRTE